MAKHREFARCRAGIEGGMTLVADNPLGQTIIDGKPVVRF
jgi:hypothetical protein